MEYRVRFDTSSITAMSQFHFKIEIRSVPCGNKVANYYTAFSLLKLIDKRSSNDFI